MASETKIKVPTTIVETTLAGKFASDSARAQGAEVRRTSLRNDQDLLRLGGEMMRVSRRGEPLYELQMEIGRLTRASQDKLK